MQDYSNLQDFIHRLGQLGWRDYLDVAVVALILFYVIRLVSGTRAASVLHGLFLVIVLYLASEFAELHTLNWLLTNFLGSIFLVAVIIFQPDIRKGLSGMGSMALFTRQKSNLEQVVGTVTDAATALAETHTGALIVLERSVQLGDVAERGAPLDAVLTKDLLLTIFYDGTPLHDGAVLIRENRIVSAACILPLATGQARSAELGTRHRAALGMSEETDAVVVVVSEERGVVSVAVDGKLTRRLDSRRLNRVLTKLLSK